MKLFQVNLQKWMILILLLAICSLNGEENNTQFPVNESEKNQLKNQVEVPVTTYTNTEGNVISLFNKNKGDFVETPWEKAGVVDNSFIIKDVAIESYMGTPPPLKIPVHKETENENEPGNLSNTIEEVLPIKASENEQTAIEKNPNTESIVEGESAPLNKEAYRLKIGDRLNISIYGEQGTNRTIAVDSTGHIHYLYVNSLFVLGKTINELRKELNEKIKEQFKHALVAITAVNVGGEYYTILGEVKSPGQKVLHGKETLLMAIASAGGINRGPFRSHTIDFGDLEKAFLTRQGKYIPINFEKLVDEGDVKLDLPLLNGDYIYIPTIITKQIYILGEVFTPTTFSYLHTVSLVEALAEAGGLTPLASTRIVVLRGTLTCPTQYLIDINLILRKCCPDFILEPGDIVYAPPMRFTALRQIVRAAVSTFVTTLASLAGTQSYLSINPAAIGIVQNPINVISTGTVVNPVIATPFIVSP